MKTGKEPELPETTVRTAQNDFVLCSVFELLRALALCVSLSVDFSRSFGEQELCGYRDGVQSGFCSGFGFIIHDDTVLWRVRRGGGHYWWESSAPRCVEEDGGGFATHLGCHLSDGRKREASCAFGEAGSSRRRRRRRRRR